MKIAVIGHGMVGHKFLEQLHDVGVADAQVTVLCEEPRPAYDRVQNGTASHLTRDPTYWDANRSSL